MSRKNRNFRSTVAVALVVCWLMASQLATSGLAAEATVLDTVKITQCHYFGFFPSLHKLSTGELLVAIKMDADAHDAEGNFWAYVISNDGGKTWGMRNTAGMVYKGEAAYTRIPRPDGCVLMLSGYPVAAPPDDYGKMDFVSVQICNHGKKVSFERDVRLTLPQPSVRHPVNSTVANFASLGPAKLTELGFVFFSGTIVESRDGGLLTSMYGKFEGDKYFRTFIARSDKAGKQWKYVTSVAGGEDAPLLDGEKNTEGFTEPRLIRLRDGRLFLLMRRGSDNMMYKSWSSDDGKRWTKPVSIGFRGVKPAVWLMNNGTLALTTGRPDPVSLYLSSDSGETWSKPTILYRERGTRYTDLFEVAPGRLLVVYDHVPFDWGVIPNEEPSAMNEIFGTFVDIK